MLLGKKSQIPVKKTPVFFDVFDLLTFTKFLQSFCEYEFLHEKKSLVHV